MKIYILRHGTTIWNEKGITQGYRNNRLSQTGKFMVEQTANIFKNTKFDIIFSSPLMRTMQTANIMNKYHNVKIIKDNRLIEIDQGIFSGKIKAGLTEEEKILKSMRSASCGMESYESAFKRAKNFINEIISNNKYENVLIVTHNVIASFLADIISKVDIDFNNPKHLRNFKNAEIKIFNIYNNF